MFFKWEILSGGLFKFYFNYDVYNYINKKNLNRIWVDLLL